MGCWFWSSTLELLDEGGGDNPVSTRFEVTLEVEVDDVEADADADVVVEFELLLCQFDDWPRKLSPWYWKKMEKIINISCKSKYKLNATVIIIMPQFNSTHFSSVLDQFLITF